MIVCMNQRQLYIGMEKVSTRANIQENEEMEKGRDGIMGE